ncbi:MAG TPA: hypothetical protein VIW67_13310 [Terriglobales bacterium]|jgi:hypothetical protein
MATKKNREPNDSEETRINEENEVVLHAMRQCWPKAADWNYVDDDHVEIMDENDRVLAVITGDDLTTFWS